MYRKVETVLLLALTIGAVGCAEVTRFDLVSPPLCDNFRAESSVRRIVEFDLVKGEKRRLEYRCGTRVIEGGQRVTVSAHEARMRSIFGSAEFQTMILKPHSFFIIAVEPVLLACVPVEYEPRVDDLTVGDGVYLHGNPGAGETYIVSARFPSCDRIVIVAPDQPAELVALDPSGSTIWTENATGGRIEFRRNGDWIVAMPASAH
jgi:hypothetical protein